MIFKLIAKNNCDYNQNHYFTPIRELLTENPQTDNIQERHLWTEN